MGTVKIRSIVTQDPRKTTGSNCSKLIQGFGGGGMGVGMVTDNDIHHYFDLPLHYGFNARYFVTIPEFLSYKIIHN